MKKGLCIATAVALILLIATGVSMTATAQDVTYLRIHIRANSDGATDQAVKLAVRDRLVTYLTPIVSQCDTFEDAQTLVAARLDELQAVADMELRSVGYAARAKLVQEEFPTRSYNGTTLPKGIYTALVVELGAARGENWWCVLYPPLCFADADGSLQYESAIAKWVRRLLGN